MAIVVSIAATAYGTRRAMRRREHGRMKVFSSSPLLLTVSPSKARQTAVRCSRILHTIIPG
jgi:hypothetical protein